MEPAAAKKPPPLPDTSPKQQRRALVSSFLGSTVEYYDFLLYGAAAGLVFPELFFPETMDRSLGAILSFVILLAGYISRPSAEFSSATSGIAWAERTCW